LPGISPPISYNTSKNKPSSLKENRIRRKNSQDKPKTNINLDTFEDDTKTSKGENQFSRTSSANSVKRKKMATTTLLFSEEEPELKGDLDSHKFRGITDRGKQLSRENNRRLPKIVDNNNRTKINSNIEDS
jgi:hypothetical protein